MRNAPKIDAAVVLELPRNTTLHIHHNLSTQQWAYVSLPNSEFHGYIPLAYIKC